MLSKELLLFFVVFVSSVGFGLDGVIMKASGISDGILIAGIRAVTASILIISYSITVNRRMPCFRKSWRFMGAMIASFVATISFPVAILEIPVGFALILFHVAILWIIVLKTILRRPVTRLDTGTGFLIFLGLIVLMYQPLELKLWGTTIGVIAGMAFAAFLFLGEEECQRVPGDRFVMLDAFLFAQIGIAVVGLSGITEVHLDLSSTSQQIILCDGLMYGVAYIILTKAIERGSSHLVAAYIGGLEPFLGILFARIFLGEEIRSQMVWGFILVATAIIGRGTILYKQEKRMELKS
jgi:uncharacterized membrane protein